MAQHKIAKPADIPEGKGKMFTVDGQDVAVFNKGGQFFAMENTCIHKGGSLGDGSLDDETVTCPLHGWQYNVTNGECVTLDLCDDGSFVETYPVKIENDEIILSLP